MKSPLAISIVGPMSCFTCLMLYMFYLSHVLLVLLLYSLVDDDENFVEVYVKKTCTSVLFSYVYF